MIEALLGNLGLTGGVIGILGHIGSAGLGYLKDRRQQQESKESQEATLEKAARFTLPVWCGYGVRGRTVSASPSSPAGSLRAIPTVLLRGAPGNSYGRKIALGSFACTPLVPSTSWVTARSTASDTRM